MWPWAHSHGWRTFMAGACLWLACTCRACGGVSFGAVLLVGDGAALLAAAAFAQILQLAALLLLPALARAVQLGLSAAEQSSH